MTVGVNPSAHSVQTSTHSQVSGSCQTETVSLVNGAIKKAEQQPKPTGIHENGKDFW